MRILLPKYEAILPSSAGKAFLLNLTLRPWEEFSKSGDPRPKLFSHWFVSEQVGLCIFLNAFMGLLQLGFLAVFGNAASSLQR